MPRHTTGRVFMRGGTWWLDYSHHGERRRVTLDTDNEGTARTKAADILRPFTAATEATRKREAYHAMTDAHDAAREAVDAARKRLPIADAWARFAEDPRRPQSGPVALLDYSQRWGRFVRWATAEAPTGPGLVNLEQVTPHHADDFARTLGDLSPNRYNKIVQTCRLVFRMLAPTCNRMANPFAEIAVKRLTTRSRRELSEKELRAVCSTATGELRTLLAVGLFTALRLHDAACLQWDAVSFRHGRLSLVPHKTARTGKAVVIPLHPVLRAILEETPEEGRTGDVLPETAAMYRRDPRKLVNSVRLHFEANKIKTQERDGEGRAVVVKSFHSLRHSFVSMAAAAGVPLGVVQELCGHGSPAVQRFYLHTGMDQARAAVNAMPEVMTPEPEAVPVEANALPAGPGDPRDGLVELVRRLEVDQVEEVRALLLARVGERQGAGDASAAAPGRQRIGRDAR